MSLLLFQLYSRKDVQPLKIKSPWLLIFSVAANLGVIVQMSVIQYEQEICVNSLNEEDF